MKKVVSLLAAAGLMAAASGAMATPYVYNDRPATITDTVGQETLQQVVDGAIGAGKINVATDQSRVGAWSLAEGNVDAYRISLLSPQGGGNFGIYSLATGTEYRLLVATTGAGGFTSEFSIMKNKLTGNYDLWVGTKMRVANFGQSFGFYWQDTKGGVTNTSYTMDSKNGGNAEALAYLIPDGTKVNIDASATSEMSTTALGNNDWLLTFDNQFASKVSGSGVNAIYDSLSDFNDATFFLEDMNPVPEPGTMMLLGAGFLGLAIYGKRRKNA